MSIINNILCISKIYNLIIMKKCYKIMLFAILAIFIGSFVSCRKEVEEESPLSSYNLNKKMTTDFSSKQNIPDWLENHKENYNTKDIKSLDAVIKSLDYSNLRVEKRDNGEDIIIIALNEIIKKDLNLVASHLKFEENAILNLIIVKSKEGKLRWSSIMSFLPAENKKQLKLSDKTVQNILNNDLVDDSGIFTFINLKGNILYKTEYKNGKRFSYSRPTKAEDMSSEIKRVSKSGTKNSMSID